MQTMNTTPTSSLPAALAMFNLTGRVALVTGSGSGIKGRITFKSPCYGIFGDSGNNSGKA